ncbi:MAG: TetR/AcrR family transcriptional regulator [Alphaproteobacteria bacterium]
MPKPVKHSIKSLPRAERKAEIIRVAAEIFGNQGYHAANMDELAATLGVGKPMLYRFFGNKKGLYKAVIAQLSKDVMARVNALHSIEDANIRIEQTQLAMRALLIQYNKVWLQARDFARSDDEIAKVVVGFRDAIVDMQSRSYAALRPEGMGEEDARATVTPYLVAMMGAAEAASEWWMTHPEINIEQVNWFSQHLGANTRRTILEALQATANGTAPLPGATKNT